MHWRRCIKCWFTSLSIRRNLSTDWRRIIWVKFSLSGDAAVQRAQFAHWKLLFLKGDSEVAIEFYRSALDQRDRMDRQLEEFVVSQSRTVEFRSFGGCFDGVFAEEANLHYCPWIIFEFSGITLFLRSRCIRRSNCCVERPLALLRFRVDRSLHYSNCGLHGCFCIWSTHRENSLRRLLPNQSFTRGALFRGGTKFLLKPWVCLSSSQPLKAHSFCCLVKTLRTHFLSWIACKRISRFSGSWVIFHCFSRSFFE